MGIPCKPDRAGGAGDVWPLDVGSTSSIGERGWSLEVLSLSVSVPLRSLLFGWRAFKYNLRKGLIPQRNMKWWERLGVDRFGCVGTTLYQACSRREGHDEFGNVCSCLEGCELIRQSTMYLFLSFNKMTFCGNNIDHGFGLVDTNTGQMADDLSLSQGLAMWVPWNGEHEAQTKGLFTFVSCRFLVAQCLGKNLADFVPPYLNISADHWLAECRQQRFCCFAWNTFTCRELNE